MVGALVYFVTTYKDDHVLCLKYLGMISSLFSISFYAAPLVVLQTVIRTRSTRLLNKSMAIVCCLNTVSWVTYGLMRSDIYIFGPNALGFILSVLQYSTFFIFDDQDKIPPTDIV